MANKSVFAATVGKLLPRPDVTNYEQAPAYKLTSRQALAQLAATGTFNATFYADAQEQLAEVIGPEDVLGIAWSRAVGAMAKALPRVSSIPVVQLTGAMSMPDDGHSSIDIVRDIARAVSGPAYVFYAPFMVPDAATAHALRKQHDVARAFDQLPRVTKAVVVTVN